MRKTIHISSMMMLFPISAAGIIGVLSAADVPLQPANAVSNDDGSCKQNHHSSDTSKKCSQKNDTPLILPFP
jgi:hypothetical protein